ncbi:hypothetical protein GCM10010411_66430 [Actinomadura fulvescens]|uniref:Uncharacterized protein n=1 Tax=Actinomadura fulvescens TaxID=46160 RepID=A0ABN3QAP5_9ACTN
MSSVATTRAGRTVATSESAEEALSIAEREVRAGPRRWVNGSVLLDEYIDYLERAARWARGRPPERCT